MISDDGTITITGATVASGAWGDIVTEKLIVRYRIALYAVVGGKVPLLRKTNYYL